MHVQKGFKFKDPDDGALYIQLCVRHSGFSLALFYRGGGFLRGILRGFYGGFVPTGGGGVLRGIFFYRGGGSKNGPKNA